MSILEFSRIIILLPYFFIIESKGVPQLGESIVISIKLSELSAIPIEHSAEHVHAELLVGSCVDDESTPHSIDNRRWIEPWGCHYLNAP